MNIGYLGVGRMSAPMIENLVADGHSVTVWNRSPDKAQALAGPGVTSVETPEAVCETGGMLISCLADDKALDAVFESGAVLTALGEGGIHLSMSTISADCAARHARSHAACGVDYLAVPILGRPPAVTARMQSFMLAGPKAGRARVRPLLEALGKKVFEFGDEAPAANVAKISFNFLIAAAVEAMGEAFSLVEKSGLDAEAFFQSVIGTAFGCPLYETYGRMLVDKAWDDVGFRLVLGHKDVCLSAQTAEAAGARMQLGELLENRFATAIENGLGEKDWTAIAVDIRTEAGLDKLQE